MSDVPFESRVRITDVSPRDGLQNEPGVIATADKARLVDLLCRAGVDEVEVTSFVSAKWVPQLGDAAELLKLLHPSPREGAGGGVLRAPAFSVLVPNDKGMAAALASIDAGAVIDKVSVFTAASETFNRRNTNASIAESIERFAPVIEQAAARDLLVRGYISCVIACPFDGPIAPAKVAEVARLLVNIGVDEIDLGDTIGAATPESTLAMLDAVLAEIGEGWLDPETFTLHLHDTFGRAASCARAALDRGVRSFDGSVAGLGGCPYASTPGKRAPGNISTETLIRTIREAGLHPGLSGEINDAALAEAAAFARSLVLPKV